MSILHSESFGSFARYSGGDEFDAAPGAGNQARESFRTALIRAAYGVYVPSNADANTSGGFTVRNDPIYPERAALCHSSAVAAGVNLGVSAAFKKKIPITDKQIIIGFSVFVPPEYVPNGSNSTVPVLRVNATTNADASWQAIGITPIYSAKECFRVCNDLSLRWGTDAAQSSKKLTVGALNYLELRIDSGQVSAWIDDTLVMQKQVGLLAEVIAFCFENNANAGVGGTNMSGQPGRWALGNMYMMSVDGIAPQLRLGPTTRIICQRPDTDVDVRFDKPAAAPSNSAVAAQDIVESPAWQLQSNTVGDFDTYKNTDSAIGDAIRSMAMVHAITTKVLGANLEADVHTVRPYSKSPTGVGGEGADDKGKELYLIDAIPAGRNINFLGIRPGDTRIWALCDASSIYVSGANYNYKTWTQIVSGADAGRFVGMDSTTGGLTALAWEQGGTLQSRAYSVSGATPLSINYPGTNNVDYCLIASSMRVFDIKLSQDNTTWVASSNFANTVAQQVQWQTNLTTAFTIRQQNITTGGGQSGGGRMGKVPGVALVWALDNPAGSIGRTNNNATSLTLQTTGESTKPQCFTWDGVALLAGWSSNETALSGGPRIRRSTDGGSSWSAISAKGSTVNGANQTLNAGASNVSTQESIFVGNAGAVVASLDGIEWRQMPRLTALNLLAAVCLPSGDFILGGQNGVLLRYGSPGKDSQLVPLSGYNMVVGTSVINPQTGAAWTPAEAADAQFGVRISS
jgi:hypothetical protein